MKTADKTIYSKKDIVTGSMCDAASRLSLLSIFQLVEDAVTDHMGDLRLDGLTAMREYGAMWVFVKNVIRVFQRPEWHAPIEVRSFISSHTAAKLMADTEILRSDDHSPVAHSRLELCALDTESGSIRKASAVGIGADTPCGAALPGLKFSRFPKCEKEAADTVRVRAASIDYCSHTNNVEYIRFILNTFSFDELVRRDVEQMEVHYGRQTFEGDVLSVGRYRGDKEDLFSVSSDEGVAVECRFRWK